MAKGLGRGELRIGIAGLGTVGVGVLRLLTENQAEISARTGGALHVRITLCDPPPSPQRAHESTNAASGRASPYNAARTLVIIPLPLPGPHGALLR